MTQKIWEFRADHRAGRVVIMIVKKGNVVGVKSIDSGLKASTYAAKVAEAKAWLKKVCGAPADLE